MSLVAKWLMHWTVDLEVTGSIAPGIILSPSVALGGDIIITLSYQSWGTIAVGTPIVPRLYEY